MTPVNDKWRSYKPAFEDVEIRMPDEEWDNDQTSDMSNVHKRRTAGLWTALACLAVVLAVAAAYGYSVITDHNARLAWLSGRLKSITSVRQHTAALEAALKQWQGQQESLAAQVHNLDAGWESRLNNVRLHAAGLVVKAYQRERNELNQRTAEFQAQIAEMTSRQNAEQIHVARLEKELAHTRQQLASVRETYTRQLAALQQQQISSQREIASLNNVLSTEQVDFEAEKDRDEEIVPGISLHLTGTDVAHQRFGAWVWLAGNRHRIWFRRQAIETPLVFYAAPGDEAYELVVTRVMQRDVAGYLLIPSDSKSQEADVALNTKSIAKAGKSSF